LKNAASVSTATSWPKTKPTEDGETWKKAYQTACTQACPAGAIVFGDLNNPEHRVHQIVKPDPKNGNKSKKSEAFRLLERLGTNTKVYYLSRPGMGPSGR
jgi:Fe-S-cluster-containing dehydrogenase component